MTVRMLRRAPGIAAIVGVGIVATIALLTGSAPSAHAGSPTAYADHDGGRACASLTPCYTTIQDAVNHVGGPEDAHVFVFPGVYNESVNLNSMASAFNHTFGNLTLMTVDGTGNPTPGTATIHGSAPISTAVQGFPNDVTVDGFTIESTQKDGVYISGLGAITIRNSTANNPGDGTSSDNTGDDGFDLTTASNHPVTVENSTATHAHGALGDGFQIITMGGATIRNTQANNNTGTQDNTGINIPDSFGDIVLDNVTTDDNTEQGIYVYTTGAISLNGEANGNGFYGAQLFTEFGLPSAANVSIAQQGTPAIAVNDFTANGNASDGLSAQGTGDVTINDSTANQNQGAGMTLLSQQNVEATNVHVEGNADRGIYIEGENAVTIDRASVIDNGAGGLPDGMRIVGFGSPLNSVAIHDSFVKDNTGQGIDLFNLLSNGVHGIGSNVICGNSAGGLRNNGTNLTVPAEGNWWGDETGPMSPQNPGGTGDKANAGGDGTIDFNPWITHVEVTQLAGPAGATGTPSTIAFTFPDDAHDEFLNNGPGDSLGPSPFTVSSDNGSLAAGNETGASVHPPIANTQLSVTLTPAQTGEAHVTLSGPCGLNSQITIQVESGFPWGDLDCSGGIDLPDVARSLRFTADVPIGDISGCGNSLATFDLDCSNTANGQDPLLLVLYLASLQPGFNLPVSCPHVGS